MKHLLCMGAVAIMFAAASTANAIVIDNFNSGGGDVQVDGGQTGLDSSFTDPGDALANHRTIAVPGSTDVTGLGLRIRANPANLGMLAFSLETASAGSGKLIWDNNGAGLGGIDLTDGGKSDQLTISVLEIDQGQVNLIFSITDTNGETSSLEISDAIVGQNNIFLADILGLADLTAVDMVMLEIQGTEASDLQIDQIATTSSVPEPASAALLGLATLGFIRRRRAA